MLSVFSKVSDLLAELKRRHVFRVAIVYGAVAWFTAQAASLVEPALNLPGWTTSLVIVFLVLGFPVALVLAWAFDLTPEGLQRTSSREESLAVEMPASPDLTARAPARVAPAAPPTDPAIAVLPFVNLSRDEDDEFFGDGLTEELISALSRVDGLRVAARTSAFAFKGRAADVREIGERLGVHYLLEGSTRRIGNRLRLRVQLVTVGDGYQAWSETFNREMEDVFTVQEEVAQAIVNVLRIKLVDAPAVPLVRSSTESVEAYTLYLKGRYFWNKRTGAALEQAIEHFRCAIAVDPDYALAHAGLADSYAMLLDYGLIAPGEGLAAVQAAASRALALDGSLAEVHTSVALARQFAWQWDEAEAGFRAAIERNPQYAVARQRYALFLAWTGRSEEATREVRRAIELDPLSLPINASAGWVAYYARDYARATRAYEKTLEMDPDFGNARLGLGQTLIQMSAYPQGLAEIQAAAALARGSAVVQALLAYATGAAGRVEEALQLAEQLRARAGGEYVPAYSLMLAYLGAGEHEQALTWLERAREEHSIHLLQACVEPMLVPLRSDPRFQRLMESMRREAVPVPPAERLHPV